MLVRLRGIKIAKTRKLKAKRAGTIRRRRSPEKIRDKIRMGVQEEDVYSEESREELVEDDELSASEEGFMQGYEQDIKRCARCGRALYDEFIEREISGEKYHFCSGECARLYEPEII